MVTAEPEIQTAPADSNSNSTNSPMRIMVENGKLESLESSSHDINKRGSQSMIDLRFYDKGKVGNLYSLH